jgi:hypothetical protein
MTGGATIDCRLALRSAEVGRHEHGSGWSGAGQGGGQARGHRVEDAEQHGQADGWVHTPRWRWHADRLGHGHVRLEIGNGLAHGPRPSRHVATRVGCELARWRRACAVAAHTWWRQGAERHGSRAARARMSASTSHVCAEPSNACGAR